MEKGAVLPLFYLPNVEFFKTLQQFNSQKILIERQEHFPKQTYRNRATISGPNGKLDLTVPILKGAASKGHTPYKNLKICYNDNWQRVHWLSLETNYRSSAYFEFYEDAFAPFYKKKFDFLFDYNLELLQMILKQLKLKIDFDITDIYEKNYDDLKDFRNELSTKKSTSYHNKKYYQVFEERNGYFNNLSIVDLLFNQGPQAAKHF